MSTVTYTTNVFLDDPVAPILNADSTLHKNARSRQDNIVALAAMLSLIQMPIIGSTNTAPVTIPLQDDRTTIANTRYMHLTQDTSLPDWFFSIGNRVDLEDINRSAGFFNVLEFVQENAMVHTENSPQASRTLPARAPIGVLRGIGNREDVQAAATLFLRSTQVDDDIENDREAKLHLEEHLERHGADFVEVLSTYLDKEVTRPSIAATILVLLGQAEHPSTHASRLNVLLEKLFSPKVRIRDGAVAGLGYKHYRCCKTQSQQRKISTFVVIWKIYCAS